MPSGRYCQKAMGVIGADRRVRLAKRLRIVQDYSRLAGKVSNGCDESLEVHQTGRFSDYLLWVLQTIKPLSQSI
jgi:hypothetical protein